MRCEVPQKHQHVLKCDRNATAVKTIDDFAMSTVAGIHAVYFTPVFVVNKKVAKEWNCGFNVKEDT